LLGAVAAFLEPRLFLVFKDWFLWFFAATMFALGVVLEPVEFWDALKKPKEIALGLLTQFTVMPVLGFFAAYLSPLEPGIALGFVIVGCAPGAMASNVIVFLAGGAVAYSIALTSFATLLSPVVTPGLVELLGGVFLPIPFWPMMLTILKVVLLPLILGMVVRRSLGARLEAAKEIAPVVAERIGSVGWLIFGLVVVVNGLGFLAGWYLARLYGFDRRYQLALMIEIGMQNAGLGVALALEHFSTETALPGALFATWCVLTGAGATTYLRWKGNRLSVNGDRFPVEVEEPPNHKNTIGY
jgi:BASS family bile acid:Na+ symporter